MKMENAAMKEPFENWSHEIQNDHPLRSYILRKFLKQICLIFLMSVTRTAAVHKTDFVSRIIIERILFD